MSVPNFHEHAACRQHPDPDLWWYVTSRFPDQQQLNALRVIEAKDICSTCPVKLECLQEGLVKENMNNRDGHGSIWGGLMTSERLLLQGVSPTNVNVVREQSMVRRVRALSARIRR